MRPADSTFIAINDLPDSLEDVAIDFRGGWRIVFDAMRLFFKTIWAIGLGEILHQHFFLDECRAIARYRIFPVDIDAARKYTIKSIDIVFILPPPTFSRPQGG